MVKKRINAGRIGDVGELTASAWLLREGYEVFRNVSSVGPIDIVVIKDGKITLVDVTTAQFLKGGQMILATHKERNAKKIGAVVLYITREGSCVWSPAENGHSVDAE